MYQVTLDFLDTMFTFFRMILAYDIIPGITLGTIFTFNFLLVAIFYTFARRS